MNVSDIKKAFGDEYPAAIMHDGIRLPLQRERRFSRSYYSKERKIEVHLSRFMDGSASITASQLEKEWPNWAEDMRSDFCQYSCWLHGQADFPEMLRYIMQHGDRGHWSGVASSVASQLPRDEAFDVLLRALHSAELGHASNFTQAIALTKHPGAEATLRKHLAALWSHRALWKDDDFTNWIAFDATTCIAHLIELAAPPSDFTDQVRRLSEHVCAGNRNSCRTFLSKHYSWLKKEE